MNPYRVPSALETAPAPSANTTRSFFNSEDLVGNLAWFTLGPVFLLISVGAAIYFATYQAEYIDLTHRLVRTSVFLPFVLITGRHSLTVIRALKDA